MASSAEFVNYVCDELKDCGEITYKKMFGEYGLYINEKFIGCIADNQCFIKITESGKKVWPNCEQGLPYETAKPYFLISDFNNKELILEFITKTLEELPIKKAKQKKIK